MDRTAHRGGNTHKRKKTAAVFGSAVSNANMFISRLVQAPHTEIKHWRLCPSRSLSLSRPSLEKSVPCCGVDCKSVRRKKADGWEFKVGIRGRLHLDHICMTMCLTGGRCSSAPAHLSNVLLPFSVMQTQPSCLLVLPSSSLTSSRRKFIKPSSPVYLKAK